MQKLSRAYVEITNVCNLACSFCAKNERVPHFMTQAEFTHIITALKPHTQHLYLHVLGEPLLHPHLADLLSLAHVHEMQVNITTNGTLLAKQSDTLLQAKALRKISISVHSLESGTPEERLHYLKQVADFAQKASAQGIFCELRLWNLGAEIDNVPVFTTLCALLCVPETESVNALANLQKTGRTTLCKNVFLGVDKRFAWPSLQAPRTEKPIFCHALRKHVAVLCDGTVVPCCLDSKGDIPLGNLHTESLTHILASPRARAMYDGFSQRKPSEMLCQRCGYATRF